MALISEKEFVVPLLRTRARTRVCDFHVHKILHVVFVVFAVKASQSNVGKVKQNLGVLRKTWKGSSLKKT